MAAFFIPKPQPLGWGFFVYKESAMGGGGGDNKVQETQYQKELAKVALGEWQRYQNVYAPLESKYMESVEKLGSEDAYSGLADDVATSYQQSFTDASENQQKQLAAAGVDPSSGKAQAAGVSLSDAQASQGAQAQSQAQHSQTEAYTGGVSNITAMGKGQQTQAINSAQDLAMAAQREANQDAIRKSQELSIPGALVGAGASWATRNPEALSNAASNLKNLDFGGTSLDATNQQYDPNSQLA